LVREIGRGRDVEERSLEMTEVTRREEERSLEMTEMTRRATTTPYRLQPHSS